MIITIIQSINRDDDGSSVSDFFFLKAVIAAWKYRLAPNTMLKTVNKRILPSTLRFAI
jgi:hypothetical protein